MASLSESYFVWQHGGTLYFNFTKLPFALLKWALKTELQAKVYNGASHQACGGCSTMVKKRRRHSAPCKFRVTPKAIEGGRTVSQVSREEEIHPTLIQS